MDEEPVERPFRASMRAGTKTALARVVAVFSAAKPHCAYLFSNRRANRIKCWFTTGLVFGSYASRHGNA